MPTSTLSHVGLRAGIVSCGMLASRTNIQIPDISETDILRNAVRLPVLQPNQFCFINPNPLLVSVLARN
jgi:hypothetical protein